mmetsp:Transcript_113001/g.292171  ORF Transcript_113001/g.292171 Transcript_113001/m.292171 type:complete len:259 (-) Transcript_113001:104-880(-)
MFDPVLGDPMFIFLGSGLHGGTSIITSLAESKHPTRWSRDRPADRAIAGNASATLCKEQVQGHGARCKVSGSSDARDVCQSTTSGSDLLAVAVCDETAPVTSHAQGPRKNWRPLSRSERRWWNESSHICPVSGFPVNMLPYPPFKFRVGKEGRQYFIDGKFLALQLIVGERALVQDHELQPIDVRALDSYMRRNKLGQHRPSRLAELVKAVAAGNSADRARAQEKLRHFRAEAHKALGRLRRIQTMRLLSDQTVMWAP